jgi:hypothetical protein
MGEQWQWIIWLVGAVAVMVGGLYGYLEYQASLLKTRTTAIPGGLRFSAHGLTVEVLRGPQHLVVQTDRGRYVHQALEGGEEQEQEGSLKVTLPAPGLRIEVSRAMRKLPDQEEAQPTGLCTIEFHASDEMAFTAEGKSGGERSALRIDHVHEKIAMGFNQFAGQVRVWVEKLEKNIAHQAQLAQQKLDAEAAEVARTARAQKAAEQAKGPSMEPADQIAQWRQVAGFSGTSEVGYTPDGRIDWFIDLDTRGRITLHAGGLTIHTNLMGAKVSTLGAELEIGVRDEYWSEAEPELQVFRLFKGAHSDVRRAWKERIEILCDKLRSGEISVR